MNNIVYKIALLVIVAFATLGFEGCNNENQTNLIVEIARLNSQCPVQVEPGIYISEAKYDKEKNLVTITYVIGSYLNQNIFDKSHYEYYKSNLRLSLESGTMEELLKYIVNANAELCFVAKSQKDDKEVSFKFTPEELKNYKGSTLTEGQQKLQLIKNSVKLQNDKCPQIEEGGTMVSVELRDSMVVAHYEIDKNYFDLRNFNNVKDDLKKI